jgi:RNA 2',3'-cyclic 3'-phosphodiesterase
MPENDYIMIHLIRTFVAVKIDAEPGLKKMISDLKKFLESSGAKWVDVNNLHLTLKFIGDTLPGQLDHIKSVLKDISVNFPVFEFDLDGLGFFKNKGLPKVLFIKINENESLKNLADEINVRLEEIGFKKEERDFRPHLTIARIKYIKEKQAFYSLADKYRSYPIQKVRVKNIILYKSILKSYGPLYKELAVARLKEQ